MNRLEVTARTWIMNNYDICFDDLVFQPSISPDFIVKNSKLSFEVKPIHFKTIVLPYSQWRNLLAYPNCIILAFKFGGTPTLIIPFCSLKEGNNQIDGYTIKLQPNPSANLDLFNTLSIALRDSGLTGSALWKEYRRIKPLCYTKNNGKLVPMDASAVYRIICRERARVALEIDCSDCGKEE